MTVFVYAKDNKINVLPMEQALTDHNALIYVGWVHTATLDPCMFIEHLHNNCAPKDRNAEIIELSHPQ